MSKFWKNEKLSYSVAGVALILVGVIYTFTEKDSISVVFIASGVTFLILGSIKKPEKP